MRQTGKSKTVVWRWQERFADEGVEGLDREEADYDNCEPTRAKARGP